MIVFRLTKNRAKTKFHSSRKKPKTVLKTESRQTRTKAKIESVLVLPREETNRKTLGSRTHKRVPLTIPTR